MLLRQRRRTRDNVDRLSIGKLARAADVSADTVRYYERRGLLAPAPRAKSGYRSYGEAELHRLIAIRRARAIGFSLSEIAELLTLRPGGDAARARALIESKLERIDSRLVELRQWRRVLQGLLRPARSGTTLESMLTAAVARDAQATAETLKTD